MFNDSKRTEAVRVVIGFYDDGMRGRGKKQTVDIIESDIRWVGVIKNDAGNRTLWKLETLVVNTKYIGEKMENKKLYFKIMNFLKHNSMYIYYSY